MAHDGLVEEHEVSLSSDPAKCCNEEAAFKAWSKADEFARHNGQDGRQDEQNDQPSCIHDWREQFEYHGDNRTELLRIDYRIASNRFRRMSFWLAPPSLAWVSSIHFCSSAFLVGRLTW